MGGNMSINFIYDIVVLIIVIATCIITFFINYRMVKEKVNMEIQSRLSNLNEKIYRYVDRRMERILSVSRKELIIPKYEVVKLKDIDRVKAMADFLGKIINWLKAAVIHREGDKSILITNEVIDYSTDKLEDYIAIISIIYGEEYRDKAFTVNFYKGHEPLATYIKISGEIEVPLYLYGNAVVYTKGEMIRVNPEPEKLMVVRAKIS